MNQTLQVLQTNVGRPREFEFRGIRIQSSMIKSKSPGPLKVGLLNIEGDRFADPRFHGRPFSVVYAYGWPHLQQYTEAIGVNSVEMGAVGENLTLDQLEESQVNVGDRFAVGSCILVARAPRIPCAKLNFRFQVEQAQKIFLNSDHPGVYFSVEEPGEIKMGDRLSKLSKAEQSFSILEMYKILVRRHTPNRERLEEIINNPHLADGFSAKFEKLRSH